MLETFTHDERKTVLRGFNEVRTYSFGDANNIASQGAEEITTFLLSLPTTVKVVNVEKNRLYQNKDIDLLWYVRSKKTGEIVKKSIEIKADTYLSQNYFFETVSNTVRNTPGCFLITESDFVFYYFIKTKELHILPTNEVRNWFLDNQEKFCEATTSTSGPNRFYYSSKGRKVPKRTAQANCNITVIDVNPFI